MTAPLILPPQALAAPGALTLTAAPEGLDALAIANLARAKGPVLHVAREPARIAALIDALRFFAPEVAVLVFPEWDCLPYDRVGPASEILARRMAALAFLAKAPPAGPFVLVTTVSALIQKVPPRSAVAGQSFSARPGNVVDTNALTAFLARNGYSRASTVMEPGEYAVRGGIYDLYPPGAGEPVRLDFFGDTLEQLRRFDPETQRTTGRLEQLDLVPAGEVVLDEGAIRRFRTAYVEQFGSVLDDPLYAAVSEGRKHQGMEHWLPLFHDRLETLFDYMPGALITADHLAEDARDARLATIADYYEARRNAPATSFSGPSYHALKPDALYLTQAEWDDYLGARAVRRFSPHQEPPGPGAADLGGRPAKSFAEERKAENVNVFEALKSHAANLAGQGKRVMIATWSEGSRDRLESVLHDHGLTATARAGNLADVLALPPRTLALAILGLEQGFETRTLAIISEQDVLGDRLVRRGRRAKRAENFLKEAASLTAGDLVVHVDHGIGQYAGLYTIDVQGAPHDCLLILYAGGDKLYLPVENIELLSRFGADDAAVQLDKLGGVAWQARRAKLKKRIKEMAAELIRIAAQRELKSTPAIAAPEGVWDEFCARFPYEETEDQERAIGDVLEDLNRGRPMDRLICGDVGFGKTEVALRAAFVVAMSGRQVAVVAPTTLLVRQHLRTFRSRFQGWPVRIAGLSRLATAKEAAEAKKGIQDGQVDIIVGTHALLAQGISFRDLGLLIIDEEQHFGVKHKERLKQLRADVHVMTLSATPIPRTLQLAMSGVKEMSLIATPPIDRLAVRTFVSPFDPVTIREALLREHYRGGQSFYVCPRIADLPEAEAFLRENVPEVKTVVAHGQMAPGQLDDVMNAFYDRQYDVLLSTTIIESGLDIPTANTMIVHRADMFGLAQLYQLRGRIGRAKLRGYAYLTTPGRKELQGNAEKRLKVLQALDSLGAGFSLASHDLDIRGAGNLLGEEQSGHIKEVGLELYQEMLEEAVAALRQGGGGQEAEDQWSPQIGLGTSVLIPEDYVTDLDIRLGLYRRLSEIETREDIDAFAAELIDRFGALPPEVKHLLEIVAIKRYCRIAGIAKVDAGPKGLTIAFRNNQFVNPAGLVGFANKHAETIKIRPDKLVVFRDFADAEERLAGTKDILRTLAEIAAA